VKAKQVEPEGQAEEAQSCVQVPAVQLVPPALVLSGMHRPPWQPSLRVQAEPMGWGVGLGAAQVPLPVSHSRDEPQDQPCRQSGKQTLASGEHT
jgi:hypothetical protein